MPERTGGFSLMNVHVRDVLGIVATVLALKMAYIRNKAQKSKRQTINKTYN